VAAMGGLERAQTRAMGVHLGRRLLLRNCKDAGNPFCLLIGSSGRQ
jgi:hypothetical protein